MMRVFSLLMILVVSGCAGVSTSGRPDNYYTSNLNRPENSEPIVKGTSSLMTEQDISRILNFRVQLPKMNRIAILKLSNERRWQNYSSDFNELNESLASQFVGRLRSSPKVYDASFLPSLLVPKVRTLPFLRSAAARYQADLLLAYRDKCRSFEKYQILNSNKTKAYCVVEMVLLDIRSGIVPFTSVTSSVFSATRTKDDNNFRETMKKAEMEAIGKALGDGARRLNKFLESVKVT